MQDEVKVTQADREAAYGAYFECYDTAPNDLWLQAMLEGRHDEDSLIQVLARHRHQAERETLARMEPVAWMYSWRKWFRYDDERDWCDGYLSRTKPRDSDDVRNVTPLYALPPAPEAGQ